MFADHILFTFIGFALGICLIGLPYAFKKFKKPVSNTEVGTLKIVKEKDGAVDMMFVDFSNEPDEFIQDQAIVLKIDIITIDYDMASQSQKNHAL